MSWRGVLRNGVGAFSDAAVLLPLIALLSAKAGFPSGVLLATTGAVYLAAAFYFRVPMAVQPLKSIAVAAVSIGATASEVGVSGFIIGVICLALSFSRFDDVSRKVPASLIHQLQVGLGVLLLIQGASAASSSLYPSVALAALMILFPEAAGVPVLGVVATLGIVLAVASSAGMTQPVAAPLAAPIRPQLVAGLVLPQVFLTLANSVLATRYVCHQYFGESASRVTVSRLLRSIGLGNVAVALLGGLPFCHGSGGVTAHARGGSSSAWSTALMGLFLLVLAAFQWARGTGSLAYPPLLLGALLTATGVFHMRLAAPTARSRLGVLKLVAAAVVTYFTRNLIWVLASGVLIEALSAYLGKPAPEAMGRNA